MKKDLLTKTIKYLADKNYRFLIDAGKGKYNSMQDDEYLKKMFLARMGYPLDLDNPRTFNEKLQWLKLHDRKEEYTLMVDKYEAKKYVAKRIGEEYVIPTIGIWDSFDDIDFDLLPDQFVLKCTHDSGGLFIVRDKSKFDKKSAKKKINKSLKTNYYYRGREWPYKNVKPRIIAEKYMEDKSLRELRDYKFFCFNGVAKCCKVDFDKFIEHHANYYDMESNQLKLGEKMYPPLFDKKIETPKSFKKMRNLAEYLSEAHPFLRADFYDMDEKVYLGELTFFPASGYHAFCYEENDGHWLELPGGYCLIQNNLVILLKLESQNPLNVYKIFNFSGEPFLIQTIQNDKTKTEEIDYFNTEWKHLDLRQNFPNSNVPPVRPNGFWKMIELARVLSKGHLFLRTDFYSINKKIYFSEFTFYSDNGFERFYPEYWDETMGQMLKI